MKYLLSILILLCTCALPAQTSIYVGGQASTLWLNSSDRGAAAGYGAGFHITASQPKWFVETRVTTGWIWQNGKPSTDVFDISLAGGASFGILSVGGEISNIDLKSSSGIATGILAKVHQDYNRVRLSIGGRLGTRHREFSSYYGGAFASIQIQLGDIFKK